MGTWRPPACPAGIKCVTNGATFTCSGACTVPTNTPTPQTNPTPTIPATQSCSLGQEVYTVGQFYCDEPSNIVKKCLGNNNWQQVNPHPCGASNCTNDPVGHSYSCAAKCEVLVDNGSNKLRIAFLPENYTNYSDFKPVVKTAIDQIKKTNLNSLVNKMNFYIVNDYNQSYHDPPYTPFDRIKFQKIHDTGQSVCGAESSIVIDNPASCGYAGGGVAAWGLFSYACGPFGQVVPHELAHSIVWLSDEYGDANSPDGLGDTGPNCSDDSSCTKWSNMSGVNCLLGCGTGNDPILGYKNWYRPSQESIMRASPNNFIFNPPSLKAWEDLLKKFQ